MAAFVHLISLTTAPNDGWMTMFASQANYSQTELTADHWTVRGAAGTAFAGWTITLYAASTFGPLAGGFPSGAIGGIDVRLADGTLAGTVRELAPLNLATATLQSNPAGLFAGDDHFAGSSDVDVFWAGLGNDSISGGGGDDYLFGYVGNDSIQGGAGEDVISASGGTIDGGAGNDSFSPTEPSARVVVGVNGVTLTNVEIVTAHDVFVTSPDPMGANYVGAVIPGSLDADIFVLGPGADSVTGNWGADTIDGGAGNDILDGSNPVKVEYWFYGGQFHPVQYPDAAQDLLTFNSAPTGISVDLSIAGPQDTRVGLKTLLNFERLEGSLYGDTLSGVGTIFGLAGDDVITGTSSDGDALWGGDGRDTLQGRDGSDALRGGAGDDLLVGGRGSDLLDGGEGFDIVDYTTATLTGVRAMLKPVSASSSDGEGSSDSLIDIEGVIGSQFADTLSASDATQGVFLAGNAGADLVTGSAFDDVLFGGADADNLTGGAGADKFVLQVDGAVDRITDFEVDRDYLLALDSGGAIAADARSIMTFDARTHLLSWDADGDAAGGPAAVGLAVLDGVSRISNANLAAGFQPTLLRLVDASGAHSDVRYAYGDTSFSMASADYNPAGQLLTYTVDYRDGHSWTKWFDYGGDQSWDTLVAEYDAQHRLTAYGSFFDDGSHINRRFDVGGVEPWRYVVEQYDTQGRLAVQGVAVDDGTSWEATWDRANTQPWGYYVEHWDAAGASSGRTYYNDDGSAFVG